ncbi:MAG: hypothetical protein WBA25_18555 [Jannaschia sp.]
MRRMILAAILVALPVAVDSVGPARAASVDCYCTDRTGGRIELGHQTCLAVGGRIFMAKCEMSQNVPMWRETGEACVTG